MTEPSEAAFRRADQMAEEDGVTVINYRRLLAKHIQNASDVAKSCMDIPYTGPVRRAALQSLILDDEPDPLEQVMASLFCANSDAAEIAADLRVELKARGLKIVQSDD